MTEAEAIEIVRRYEELVLAAQLGSSAAQPLPPHRRERVLNHQRLSVAEGRLVLVEMFYDPAEEDIGHYRPVMLGTDVWGAVV